MNDIPRTSSPPPTSRVCSRAVWEGFAARAIGVPFRDGGRDWQGWDCWGLIVAAYRECLSIRLPSYEDISALEIGSLANRIEAHLPDWLKIPDNQAEAGDVVLLRQGGLADHVGLVFYKGRMLHVMEGIDTCLERYDGMIWRHRVVGIYRYAGPGPD